MTAPYDEDAPAGSPSRNPSGVSVAQVVCPACGEIIEFSVLFESATQPATIFGTVDIAPVREHVERMHPEVADEDETA